MKQVRVPPVLSHTVATLEAQVPNGALVVLSHLRTLPLLVELRFQGWQCRPRLCWSQGGERFFHVGYLPLEQEETPTLDRRQRLSNEPLSIVEDAGHFIQRSNGKTFWIANSDFAIEQGHVWVPPLETTLIQELRRRGYDVRPVPQAPWVFRASPPPS